MSDLQKEITDLIPSKDLKNRIRESGFVMNDHTLLITILDCAPDFHSRIKYLEMFSRLSNCKTAKLQAQNIISVQKCIYKSFDKADENTVFEVHIKEFPNDFDNRYLCKTYQNALDMIDAFFKYYEFHPNPLTRCKITKRRILSNTFSEDIMGEAEFTSNKALYSIEDYTIGTEECDGCCKSCEKYCLHPDGAAYPIFTSEGELVKYTTADGNQQYGFVNWFGDNSPQEYACIIPIDTPYMHYRDFENACNSHTHIKQTFIEKADCNMLSEELKGIYWDYIKFINAH